MLKLFINFPFEILFMDFVLLSNDIFDHIWSHNKRFNNVFALSLRKFLSLSTSSHPHRIALVNPQKESNKRLCRYYTVVEKIKIIIFLWIAIMIPTYLPMLLGIDKLRMLSYPRFADALKIFPSFFLRNSNAIKARNFLVWLKGEIKLCKIFLNMKGKNERERERERPTDGFKEVHAIWDFIILLFHL